MNNIDPNIYVGSIIALTSALLGYFMGIARPYLDKRLLAKTNNNPLGVNGTVKQPQAGSKPVAQDAITGPIIVQPPVLQQGAAGGLP